MRGSRYPAPLPAEHLRAKRKGKAGPKRHADETYLKVGGVGCSPYRAIDADGTRVDPMPSERRDVEARVPACGCRFLARSLDVVGHAQGKVATDRHDAYPRHPGDSG